MMRSRDDLSQPDGAAWPGGGGARGARGRPGPAAYGYRGELLTAADERAPFAVASGILGVLPEAVARPCDAEDLRALVRWAATERVPLVPRGAGTGMPGGNVGAGISVDLVSGFRDAPLVDAAARLARVRPGVTLAELNRAAAPAGLHFPVDPSSADRATLGGMIANNSGGAHSVQHGSTRRWVESLQVVLADGSAATLRRGERPPDGVMAGILRKVDAALRPHAAVIRERWPATRKNASGYALLDYLDGGDALDLLVGSEGTLALVTGAELRLAERMPHRGLALLEFTSLERAGAAVLHVLELAPAACEMIDRTFIDLVRASGEDPGYPLCDGLEAILFVEFEGGSRDEITARLEALRQHLAGDADRIAMAIDPEEQERFWHVRHAASPLIARMAGERISMQFIEDGVVPVARLADYIRLLRGVLAAEGLPAVIFGHAGDGNLHVNPLVDVSRAGWRERLEAIMATVAEGVAALGGTMTGEHGDGRMRAPLLETIWGAEMVACFRAVKNAFDPDGILNPGVVIPLPGQRPLDAIRY